MAWLVPYANLSDEQIRAVEAPVSSHRFIMGAPGSGKSLVLVHRAARLRDRYNIDPSRYRILVFTNVLKDYIRSACLELGIDDECITTFDRWCIEYHEKHIGNRPWNNANRQPDFPRIRESVLEHVRGTRCKPFDFVLVDEGQDLDQSAFQTITAVAEHVTVCADYKQQIYDHGASEPDIAARLGLKGANFNLLSAFRCSPDLVPLAATFVADPEERRLFVEQSRTWSGARERPLLFIAADAQSERQRLATVVRERLSENERIAVLFPQTRQVAGFAKAMDQFGITVEAQTANRRNSLRELDFNSPNPKLLTYHSAKGLTFDSVLMPRLVESSFPNSLSENLRRLLFVGLTRAVRWTYMSTVESTSLALLNELVITSAVELAEIQRGSAVPMAGRSKGSTGTEPTVDDLI